MEAQLHLLPTEEPRDLSWRLDESTRAIGRRGVSDARAALQAALRHRASDEPDRLDRADHQSHDRAVRPHASAA